LAIIKSRLEAYIGTGGQRLSQIRGYSCSPPAGAAQNVSVSSARAYLWHDSQRREASQDFCLSSASRNLPLRAGISHFRTEREILATFPFHIC
jgi:hypothetical protein